MKCESCLALLDEYLEGEMEVSISLQVSAHLSACVACAARHEELQREQQFYANYLLDVEASPKLWAGLRASIEQRKIKRDAHARARFYDWLARSICGASTRWQRRYAGGMAGFAFMAIVIAVLSSVLISPYRRDAIMDTGAKRSDASVTKQLEDTPESKAVVIADAAREPVAAPLLLKARDRKRRDVASLSSPRSSLRAEAGRQQTPSERETNLQESLLPGEKSYLEAIARVSALVEKSPATSMQPQLRAAYQRNLAAVDQAIAQTRLAALSDPGNPQMAQFVLTAYRGKLGLLTTIAEQSRVVAAEF